MVQIKSSLTGEDGLKFKFWEDEWLDNTQLKEKYLIIYLLRPYL